MLDHNHINSHVKMPEMPKLHTLWVNHNKITNLSKLLLLLCFKDDRISLLKKNLLTLKSNSKRLKRPCKLMVISNLLINCVTVTHIFIFAYTSFFKPLVQTVLRYLIGHQAGVPCMWTCLYFLSRINFKTCKNKGADQLYGTSQLISAFVFATYIV